jgi:hypothetical protein
MSLVLNRACLRLPCEAEWLEDGDEDRDSDGDGDVHVAASPSVAHCESDSFEFNEEFDKFRRGDTKLRVPVRALALLLEEKCPSEEEEQG